MTTDNSFSDWFKQPSKKFIPTLKDTVDTVWVSPQVLIFLSFDAKRRRRTRKVIKYEKKPFKLNSKIIQKHILMYVYLSVEVQDNPFILKRLA